ncbi:MAG: hypothetical protein V1930_03620 [Pseudomonadota bacterium]
MKKIISTLALIILTAFLIHKEHSLPRPKEIIPEGCIHCHNKVSDPDPSHPISAFGCHLCHLGNPYSLLKERAHFHSVKNPGDLRVVDRTCGRIDCHFQIASRVKRSIMATNRGMLKTIQKQWLNVERSSVDVEMLLSDNPPDNLAIEHYRKMCGGCHLWKKRGDFPGEKGLRGGGCTDCHIIDDHENKSKNNFEAFSHTRITTRIPSENCVKCHNRSARIGLSYFGRFESEGYGTPYDGMDLTSRRLSGNRFYIQLPADVHFSKAGMDCVDCHTGTGLMGDGRIYDQMEDQTDITCEACHTPEFYRGTGNDSLAARLAFLNRKVPDVRGKELGITKKGTPLYNLQRDGEKIFLFRKRDGYPIEMGPSPAIKSHHGMRGHDRLSCQSCHSSWMPQCYGCHLTVNKGKNQRDWLTGQEWPGLWEERRSYSRFSRPALGLKNDSTVSPFSPCQVFVSYYEKEGQYRPDLSFKIFTMSSFDPHTTQKGSRSCQECHGDPKILGLGEGSFSRRREGWQFRATYDPQSSGLGASFAMDAFVNIQGEALQGTPRRAARPFDKEELERILWVNACVGCHGKYEDKIYLNFELSKKRFNEDDLPCKR